MRISSSKQRKNEVKGDYINLHGEDYYKISNYDQMPPFFMTIVSDSDHWLFISSNGGLTAGRVNAGNSVFPYYTDDKIHEANNSTGSFTKVLIEGGDDPVYWAPFVREYDIIQEVERNLYKNRVGNKVIFEEINHAINLQFRYSWNNSERFGIVRTASITNLGAQPARIKLLDGVRNILPWGIKKAQQMTLSNLMDAYKKSELLTDSKVAVYRLSSIPVDRAEPSEGLRVNTAWSTGLEGNILLSELQVPGFIEGSPLETEVDVRAQRGAFLIETSVDLPADQTKEWMIVLETAQDSGDVSSLVSFLKSSRSPAEEVQTDIDEGTVNLEKMVAKADGLQLTGSQSSVSRHFSNTMFNIMRGGVFDDNYQVSKNDFLKHINTFNKRIFQENEAFFDKIPDQIAYNDLLASVDAAGNKDLLRLTYEYLPLIFGRRHGDPSRPWNQFSIHLKDEKGDKRYYYEGNWRDIFQNWEALSFSFPEYVESMISKFVNASTPDGYNPYRISRDGIDWEVLEPDDEWSYVGYWGDHQIIYLQKLLEFSSRHHPGRLISLLDKEVFVHADVPYRIRTFEEIVADPYETIIFDEEVHEKKLAGTEKFGADGKLLLDENDRPVYCSLFEKILITTLAKLSNLVPDAGIWLNTQRPEWNDANNALVGNGASMVTVYYMRRYLVFLNALLKEAEIKSFQVSEEVAEWYTKVEEIFRKFSDQRSKGFDDKSRYNLVAELGEASSTYRETIYKSGFSGKSEIHAESFTAFADLASEYLNSSIDSNKRQDSLYHAYNLLKISDDSIEVLYLYEMLEGQVAVLSSGIADVNESKLILEGLRSSLMYREDQNSYTLYPDRKLPRFEEKNIIPEDRIQSSKLLTGHINSGDTSIAYKDIEGAYHFNAAFNNGRALRERLEQISNDKEEIDQVLEIYEDLFDHRSFTGRSGTFFGYEGLGSIYWHMVSKLLLAVQEIIEKNKADADNGVINDLIEKYYEIRAGIGYDKKPEEYGAFPTDAYSHTPGLGGVRQPGMTGQVKEDVITRFAELGVQVDIGQIGFNPYLLRKEEILDKASVFHYYDIEGNTRSIDVPANGLAFTYCQVPVVYEFGTGNDQVLIRESDGEQEIEGHSLDTGLSASIFTRSDQVKSIHVSFKDDSILI